MLSSDKLNTILDLYTGSVLDFGCGICRFSLQAIQENRCTSVVLHDTSKSIISFIRWLIEKRELLSKDISIYDKKDIFSYLEGKTFDRIFILDFLEHIKDPLSLLKSLKCYLKDTGVIAISAPFNEVFQPGHLKMHKDINLSSLVEEAGFSKLQFKDIT
jgi:2-polyprenyl-3-methyl-5-hydroxy-6-metoxy-1,4-benzoquinol methylase